VNTSGNRVAGGGLDPYLAFPAYARAYTASNASYPLNPPPATPRVQP